MTVYGSAVSLKEVINLSDTNSTAASESNNSTKPYNILSLDGAGLNGIVLASFLDKVEDYAFNVTQELNE
jgi:hypothetical protein